MLPDDATEEWVMEQIEQLGDCLPSPAFVSVARARFPFSVEIAWWFAIVINVYLRSEPAADPALRKDVADALEQVVAAQPDNADAWGLLASKRDDCGDAVGALAAYDRALALEPDAGRYTLRAGLLEDAGRHRDAIASLLPPACDLPDDPEVVWYRSMLQRGEQENSGGDTGASH